MPSNPGINHHKSKLTEDQVRNIRALRKQGLSYMKICAEIDWVVGTSAVQNIIDGRSYKDVKDEE